MTIALGALDWLRLTVAPSRPAGPSSTSSASSARNAERTDDEEVAEGLLGVAAVCSSEVTSCSRRRFSCCSRARV